MTFGQNAGRMIPRTGLTESPVEGPITDSAYPVGSGSMILPDVEAEPDETTTIYAQVANPIELKGSSFFMQTITANEHYHFDSIYHCTPYQGTGLANNDEGFYAIGGEADTFPSLYNTGSSWSSLDGTGGIVGAVLAFAYEGLNRTCFNYMYSHIWANWADCMWFMKVGDSPSDLIYNQSHWAVGDTATVSMDIQALLRPDGTIKGGPFVDFDDQKYGSTSTGAGQQPVTVVVERSVPGFLYISPLDDPEGPPYKGSTWTMMANPWETIAIQQVFPFRQVTTANISFPVDETTLTEHYIRVRSISGHLSNYGGDTGPCSWGFLGTTGSEGWPTGGDPGAGLDHGYATANASCLSIGGVSLTWPGITAFQTGAISVIKAIGVDPCNIVRMNGLSALPSNWEFLAGSPSAFTFTDGIASVTTSGQVKFRAPIRTADQWLDRQQLDRLYWNVSKASWPGSSNYTLNITFDNGNGAESGLLLSQSGTSLNIDSTDNRGTVTDSHSGSESSIPNGGWLWAFMVGRADFEDNDGYTVGVVNQTTIDDIDYGMTLGFPGPTGGDAGTSVAPLESNWYDNPVAMWLVVDFDAHGETTTFSLDGWQMRLTGTACPIQVPCSCFGSFNEVNGALYTATGTFWDIEGSYTLSGGAVYSGAITYANSFSAFADLFLDDFRSLTGTSEVIYRFKFIDPVVDETGGPQALRVWVGWGDASVLFYPGHDQRFYESETTTSFGSAGLDWSKEISVKFRRERTDATTDSIWAKWWNSDEGESDWAIAEVNRSGPFLDIFSDPSWVDMEFYWYYDIGETQHVVIYPPIVTGDGGYSLNGCATYTTSHPQFANTLTGGGFGSCGTSGGGGGGGSGGTSLSYLSGTGNALSTL